MGGVNILVGAYRDWAHEVVSEAITSLSGALRGFVSFSAAETPDELARLYGRRNEARNLGEPFDLALLPFDLALLIGWSWILPSAMVADIPCVCLHPSLLPAYRGGSPLQHQLINGETEGGITLFRMNDEIDAGPIYAQASLSLEGSLADIFERIVETGAPMVADVIRSIAEGHAAPRDQDIGLLGRVWKRRKPEESEITAFDLGSARHLHNKIRALDHPDYPRAFVTMPNGGKVYLSSPGFEPGTEVVMDGGIAWHDQAEPE